MLLNRTFGIQFVVFLLGNYASGKASAYTVAAVIAFIPVYIRLSVYKMYSFVFTVYKASAAYYTVFFYYCVGHKITSLKN